MENQVTVQNQELTAKQQTQWLEIAKDGKLNEVSFVKKSIDFVQIKDLDKTEISQALGVVFLVSSNLIGIKEPISDINKKDIAEMIFKHYKTLSIEEVAYAFKMERYGLLEPKSQHYQLFNSDYASEVLNKYKKYRQKIRFEHSLPISKSEKPDELTDEEKEQIVIQGVFNCFETFKATGKIELGSLYVYDFLYENKMLPDHDKRFRNDIKKRAIKKIYKDRDNVKSLKEKKSIKATLLKIQQTGNVLRTTCRELILIEFFTRIINTDQNFSELLSKNYKR